MGSRRFHPNGKGWIRVVDYGNCAGWLRPNPDGPGVQAVLYGPADWVGREPYGTRHQLVYEVTEAVAPWFVIDELFNKPGRFHWLATEEWTRSTYGDGTPKPAARDQILWSARVMPVSHQGHRRLNPKRKVYLGRTEPLTGYDDRWGWGCGKRLPRKLRVALYGEH